ADFRPSQPSRCTRRASLVAPHRASRPRRCRKSDRSRHHGRIDCPWRAAKMKHVPTAIRITLFIALMAFLVRPEWFEPLLSPLTQANAPAIYNRGSLLGLAAQHLATVAIATFCATFIAVGMAILVTRESGSEFLPFARSVVNIGQTFPPVAVLALAVPAVGFGEKPTLIALFLYALLPIFENTLAALTTLPRDVTE